MGQMVSKKLLALILQIYTTDYVEQSGELKIQLWNNPWVDGKTVFFMFMSIIEKNIMDRVYDTLD